jgi:hypothetical protein
MITMAASQYTSNNEIPYGYCQCGCGQMADIAVSNSARDKTIKGQPLKYANGHRSKRANLAYALWSHVAITADDNKCWEWLGTLDGSGYGQFSFNGKMQRSHRVAWMYPNYVIPDGMVICHSCDNPACCNPKHLWLGTNQENMDDMVAKNRSPNSRGERNPNVKLTSEMVAEIRNRFATEKIRKINLAREYGIGNSQIHRILSNEHWKEIT